MVTVTVAIPLRVCARDVVTIQVDDRVNRVLPDLLAMQRMAECALVTDQNRRLGSRGCCVVYLIDFLGETFSE
jgi:hypothetical protein